ncbi:MAG: HAMP domain-containing protein [Solirubrobacterales bacterium]|nr:HAMP domain-containing protein [Solirubrobacterales bacterium]
MRVRLPLRLKLTLAFAVLMTLLLGGFGLAIFFHTRSSLDAGIDRELAARAADVATLVQNSRSSSIPGRGNEPYAQILAPDGRVLATSLNGDDRPLFDPAEVEAAASRPTYIRRGESARLLGRPVELGGRERVIVVGTSIAEREQTLETLGAALLAGGPIAVLLASLAVYALAGRALRPIDRMRRRARQISLSDSEDRLPLPTANDEVRALGETLNEMLDRLAATVDRERRFSADVSHELRTPLAILKMELEVGKRASLEDPTASAESFDSAVEEVERLSMITEDLLLLTRSDHDSLELRRGPVPLRALVERTTRRLRLLDGDGRRKLRVEVPAITLVGDGARLEQALTALLDNAYRHGAGPIQITARVVDGQAELHVTDQGQGIPEEFSPVAFERFSRAEAHRGDDGTGLGLAIVAAIAEAHGGKFGVAHDTGGADVWFSVPVYESRPCSP